MCIHIAMIASHDIHTHTLPFSCDMRTLAFFQAPEGDVFVAEKDRDRHQGEQGRHFPCCTRQRRAVRRGSVRVY